MVRQKFAFAAACAAFIAGSLDLVASALMYHVPPDRLLKWIASGWTGREAAFAGGLPTMLLGLASHYAIALAWAVAYAAASVRWPVLRTRPWVCGPVCGLLSLAVMYGVVVPISRADLGNMSVTMLIESVFIHAFVFGLPLALAVARFSREKTA